MPTSSFLPAILLILALLPNTTLATESDLQILLNLKQTLHLTNQFQSWNPRNDTCSFTGITCTPSGSIAEINLAGNNISGPFPFASLCRLPSLSKLILSNNDLISNITSLNTCTSLQHLDLATNQFSGPVPDLSPLINLQILNLSDNSFSGPFPWGSLANLTSLQVLSLGDNTFESTPFPDVVVKLTNLSVLYLSDSNLHGSIPPSIGNLINLQDLEIADNFLSGGIPPEISKLTKLRELELYNNSLTGGFPPGFGDLTELQFLDASMNNLSGDLSELRFLSNLVSLQLFYNNFSGELPPEFGDFKYLVNLSLYSNSLSGELPEKLGSLAEFNFIDVSTNYFTGRIPPDMCFMGTMERLLMLENNLSGEIPDTYANCSTLLRFRVSSNSLTGTVPSGIWSLPHVNIIDLEGNYLEGPVTSGIGEAKALYQLYLADNQFSGELPPEIAGATSLFSIDISSNRFSGLVPASIGGLKNLNSLHLEHNAFSGDIPDSLGSCAELSDLNFTSNSLTGPIPASLGNLQRLNSLDLSNNQLSGEIPATLLALKLSALNLSNNHLTGTVPPGLSIDAYSLSFLANPGLCGNGVNYLRPCSPASGGSSSLLRTMLTCFLVAVALLLATLGTIIFIKRRRSFANGDQPIRKDSWDLKSFRIMSFNEQEIIDSVRRENLIGRGGSGNVYKVELGNGKVVAVKHIWNSPAIAALSGGEISRGTAAMLPRRTSSVRSREFDAEVGTLSTISHVNVVKLYCSITSEDSSLLVYEHLPNGSLWDRLHGPAREKLGLNWEARYEIAMGSARGLEYLHHGWDRPIVHRDVKSSNILIDASFKPRIADFGLARILQAGGDGRGEWSEHVVAGTYGYIAPEYGYTWRVDEKSDVYSFGVVLMELVTGRRPIEAEYGDNKDIVGWVSERLTSKESVAMLVDTKIQLEAEREEAVKMLRIATLCTSRLPISRPSIRTVVQMLEEAGGNKILDARSKTVHEDDNKIEAKKSFEKLESSPNK